MRKIYYNLEIGYSGCGDEGILEIGDNETDEEIQEIVNDMASQWASQWDGDTRLGWYEDMTEEEEEEENETFWQSVSGSWRWATPDDE